MQTDCSSDHPGTFDAAVLEPLAAALRPVCSRMWPWTLHGLDRLPDHDRFLVVANHSGMGTAELATLVLAWHDRFGGSRPVAGMAHPTAFRVPVLKHILQGLGAVEATREGAAKARRAGVPLLLFPGGDHESSRPLWHADRVDFAGRKGWIRLAREHGLTIVPMCITGSHRTLPILMHGRAVAWLTGARLMGIRRMSVPVLSLAAAAGALQLARSTGLGGAGSAAAAWLSFWATVMVPWIPSAIGFHILPPIGADELVDSACDDDVYQRVVGALERALRSAA